MNNSPDDPISEHRDGQRVSTKTIEHHRDEVRFWQGVALALAIFVLSVLFSLVLGVGFLWLSR